MRVQAEIGEKHSRATHLLTQGDLDGAEQLLNEVPLLWLPHS